MLLVPAGSFQMGADEGGEQDEHPAHEVRLDAFYLDETEVTNEAYAEALAAGVVQPPSPQNAKRNGFGSDRRFRKPRQPVSSISWLMLILASLRVETKRVLNSLARNFSRLSSLR